MVLAGVGDYCVEVFNCGIYVVVVSELEVVEEVLCF